MADGRHVHTGEAPPMRGGLPPPLQAIRSSAANRHPRHHPLQPLEVGDGHRDRAALRATMVEMIHFDYDVSEVRTQDRARLDAKAAILRVNPALRIRITGNCDERGSDEYNIALGMRRAMAARDYLVRIGVDSSRIDVATLGREKPLDPGSTEEAWAKNRRDEFDILAGRASRPRPGGLPPCRSGRSPGLPRRRASGVPVRPGCGRSRAPAGGRRRGRPVAPAPRQGQETPSAATRASMARRAP